MPITCTFHLFGAYLLSLDFTLCRTKKVFLLHSPLRIHLLDIQILPSLLRWSTQGKPVFLSTRDTHGVHMKSVCTVLCTKCWNYKQFSLFLACFFETKRKEIYITGKSLIRVSGDTFRWTRSIKLLSRMIPRLQNLKIKSRNSFPISSHIQVCHC